MKQDNKPIHPDVRIGHVHLKVADLRDPDGNGVELYWDRPKQQWPRTADGGLHMDTRPLDLEDLIKEGS